MLRAYLLLTSLCISVGVATASEATIKPTQLSELTEKLSTALSSDVFVKPLDGTQLFVVVMGDSVLFTDSNGSVLINGDILTLADNVIISKVVKEEFEVLRRKARIASEAKIDDVSLFLKNQPLPNRNNPTKLTDSASSSLMEERSDDKPTTVMGYTKDKLDFEVQCIEKIQSKNGIIELTSLFTNEMSKEEAISCGQVFANAVVKNLPDSTFINYVAANEKSHVTIFSDYTCSFCITEHRSIDSLLKQGISVKVYPYGRDLYRERLRNEDGEVVFGDYTVLGKNMLAAQCFSDDNSEQIRLFDTLMSNPAKYAKEELPEVASVDFNSACAIERHRQKLYGDLFTARGTPLHVFANGTVYRGKLSVSQIVDRAL
ncbi:hypothetical protein M2G93_16700 [Vibrio vulnificus]|uniref:hypothetical protein n=1 Tax=Vibrio vulnificus TaxID=672 RepID=UPI0021DB17CF|nr:hypothetical protein [Vibrio vulnificus]EHD1698137.1 hypothetical protein [Vibrio vulnificus]EKZ9225866.1 hypothetical protein [Vibrio vulnificus]ELC9582708.1 hypothetical protein [Vibrio vulnificus]MCU8149755.1 hypothetical protein [Vibrio vulnificus]